MFNHAPAGYICPFCNFAKGHYSELNTEDSIVHQDEELMAFIAPGTWPNNKGHVIVIPTNHYENIYDIPDEVLSAVYKFVKKISIAIRNTYECEGTSTRQHNEPSGGQDVWHFHVHVFPRYEGDNLYQSDRITIGADERAPYAKKLKEYMYSIQQHDH